MPGDDRDVRVVPVDVFQELAEAEWQLPDDGHGGLRTLDEQGLFLRGLAELLLVGEVRGVEGGHGVSDGGVVGLAALQGEGAHVARGVFEGAERVEDEGGDLVAEVRELGVQACLALDRGEAPLQLELVSRAYLVDLRLDVLDRRREVLSDQQVQLEDFLGLPDLLLLDFPVLLRQRAQLRLDALEPLQRRAALLVAAFGHHVLQHQPHRLLVLLQAPHLQLLRLHFRLEDFYRGLLESHHLLQRLDAQLVEPRLLLLVFLALEHAVARLLFFPEVPERHAREEHDDVEPELADLGRYFFAHDTELGLADRSVLCTPR